MMEETSIEIRNLKKYYAFSQKKGFSFLDLPDIVKNTRSKPPMIKVLDGIDLDIRKGECFGIIGPNGTGKSTLLRLIAGIIPPDSGTVKCYGSLIPLLNLSVGFSSELNARDNVYQYGMILGFSKREMDALYDEIITFAGLEDFQDMHLKNFSSGMRIKLAFSTAVQINPDILVLDEVLAVGDVAFKEKSQKKILEFCNSDKTVVIVSHSMGTIASLCDRAMFLKDGKIFSIGDPQEVIDAYLDAMSQNVLPQEIRVSPGVLPARTGQPEEYTHKIIRQIAEMNVIPLIREQYDTDIERSLNEYLTWEYVKRIPDFEVLRRSWKEEFFRDNAILGSSVIPFLETLGDETASRKAADEIIRQIGLVCFGNNNLVAFFSDRSRSYDTPPRFSTLLVCDDTQVLPVITDIRTISRQTGFQILEKTNSTQKNATIVFPPELFSDPGIAALLDSSIRFLAPVPVQLLEDRGFVSDFFAGITSTGNMNIIFEKPVFMKKGPVDLNGRPVEGFGYYDPRRIPPDYSTFFSRMDMLETVFNSTAGKPETTPDTVINEIAKKDAKYFSGTLKSGHLEISLNPVSVSRRQSLMGMVFCYHSGPWNAEECYRKYEQWQLTDRSFRFYQIIISSDNARARGKTLLSLITTAVQLGVLKNSEP